VNELGQGVPDARLTWTRLPDVREVASWPWPAIATRQALSAGIVSDSEGRFTGLAELQPSFGGTALWITHPDFESVLYRHSVTIGVEMLPDAIVLRSATGIEVLVIDMHGQPVPGAAVHQRLEHPYDSRAELDPDENAARLALWRTARTDASGRARMAFLPGRQFLHADADGLLSRPWRGAAPDSTTLTLVPTVTCRALVTVDDATIDLTRSQIEAFAKIGGRRRLVGASPIEQSGRVEPFSIPALESERYEFELSGGSCVPTVLIVPTPVAGSVVNVEIAAKRGHPFSVRVVDTDDAPVLGSRVAWAWQSGDEWMWWSEGSIADGRCSAEAIPFGHLWIEATKPGYLPYKVELDFVQEFAPAFAIVLDRAGTLRGSVTSEGEPVPNFTIVTVPAKDFADMNLREHVIKDSKDGRYEIPSVPLGEVAVFAFSDDRPRTLTKRVDIVADVPGSCDFELPRPRLARGRVRDAVSSGPLAGAAVQIWVTGHYANLRPWGNPAVTDADGSFEIEGLSPEFASQLRVQAEGYAGQFVHIEPSTQSAVDIGVVALGRPQTLEASIRVEEDRSPTIFSASLRGGTIAPVRSFDERGMSTFDGLLAGSYKLRVNLGEEWWQEVDLWLQPTRPTRIAWDLRRVRELAIAVSEPGALPVDTTVSIHYISRSLGRQVLFTSYLDPKKAVDIGFLDGASFHVDLFAPGGRILGSGVIQDADNAGPIHMIRLGGIDRKLRVVDQRGEPLSHVTVSVAEDRGTWLRSLNSDARGEVVLTAFPGEVADFNLFRADIGASSLHRVRLNDETSELVLAPDARVSVRVTDGDVPLAGVQVRILDLRWREVVADSPTTNLDGEAISMSLDSGEYELQVDQAGLWPMRMRIRAQASSPATNVQVRRVGSAVLHAKRGGLAVADQQIRLKSEEFEVQVADWLHEGRPIAVLPESGRTDGKGVLIFDALPTGKYRWSIQLSDGVVIGGSLLIEPGTRAAIDIAIP